MQFIEQLFSFNYSYDIGPSCKTRIAVTDLMQCTLAIITLEVT